MMLYVTLKWLFLLATAPIWVIPWAVSKARQSRRPVVKVKVRCR